MRRRDFLKRSTAAAAGTIAASYVLPARAQSRQDTLLTLSESGPNNLDPGYAVTQEPICVLAQESLAQFGIKATLNKVPGANWRAEF